MNITMDYVKMIQKYKSHEADTGSPAVQIVLLSEQINDLGKHLGEHNKDNSSRLGLLKIIGKRRRLLDYLAKENSELYSQIVADLKLRK
jgi:small subunit ribosomal protein S15